MTTAPLTGRRLAPSANGRLADAGQADPRQAPTRLAGTDAACLPGRARAEAFARVWSAQEACVTAVGRGLSGRPWPIPVDPAAPAGVWSAGSDQDVGWVGLDRLAPTALAMAARLTSTMDIFTRPRPWPLDRSEEQ